LPDIFISPDRDKPIQNKMNRIKSLLADSESLLIFGIIAVATIITALVVGKYLNRVLIRKTKDHNIDVTRFLFIKQFVTVIIYLVGFGWAFLSLPISANFGQALFAGAGASTLIVGFASQQILSNFMSGIVLVVKKPFKINDTIEIQGNKGKVIEINLHDTVLADKENNFIIIPNSLISNSVIKNIRKE
jgi:small-conductance mechanosensitive channel